MQQRDLLFGCTCNYQKILLFYSKNNRIIFNCLYMTHSSTLPFDTQRSKNKSGDFRVGWKVEKLYILLGNHSDRIWKKKVAYKKVYSLVGFGRVSGESRCSDFSKCIRMHTYATSCYLYANLGGGCITLCKSRLTCGPKWTRVFHKSRH